MALTLSGFTISRTGDTYQITIEDEDGGAAQYEATYDQLDLIVEAIEERLDGAAARPAAGEGLHDRATGFGGWLCAR
jgi:hypothetical protein